MIINDYKNEINKTIEILTNIKSLKFTSINIYGSSINDEIFNKGYSDIDMIFMYDDSIKNNLEDIAKEINDLNLNYKEKKPMIVDDHLCKRIEFYLKYPNIPVDVTISKGLIPTKESLEKDAWYDNFEALMGGVYEYSKNIYGNIPDYEKFQKEFYPFYSDELREKRLNILATRIFKTNELLLKYVNEKNMNLIDELYKIRKHFIQFLYIYNRKYFLSPEKHTYYQLTHILSLSEEEKKIICLLEGDLYYSAYRFIQLSNDYIEKYNKENKTLKKVK